MPPRGRHRIRLSPFSVGFAIGAVGCFATALFLWALSAISHQQTASLSPITALSQLPADPVAEPPQDIGQAPASDSSSNPDPWADAEARYPGLALWLEVDGAGIATPVMQATGDSPDWFLDHDAYGNETTVGIPYLDCRCRSDSPVKTIYAHNLGWGASEGFGSLADAWRQDAFDAIGDLRLAVRPSASMDSAVDPDDSGEGPGVKTYRPLCARKVTPDDPDAVCLDDDADSIGQWLTGVRQASSASTGGPLDNGVAAHSVVTLVTCAGDGYPSQSRTVVVFVEGGAPVGSESQRAASD